MDKTTHEVRRSGWMNIIEQCQNRPEGISAKQTNQVVNILIIEIIK